MGLFETREVTDKKGRVTNETYFNAQPIKDFMTETFGIQFGDKKTVNVLKNVKVDGNLVMGDSHYGDDDIAEKIKASVKAINKEQDRVATSTVEDRIAKSESEVREAMAALEAGEKIKEFKKKNAALGAVASLNKLNSIVDTIAKENEEKETSIDDILVPFDMLQLLDGMLDNGTLREQASAINAFYKTLPTEDRKLQVIKFLYDTVGEMGDKERLSYMKAFTKAGMKDETNLIDEYLTNNINEVLFLLTEVW